MKHSLLLILLLVVFGCYDQGDSKSDLDSLNSAEMSVSVSSRMGSVVDPGFKRVLAPRLFVFPEDHGPHPEYATEWWYFTGNVRSESGTALGYQLTVFRVGLKPPNEEHDSPWRSREIYMGHLAVTHLAKRAHKSAERFSRSGLQLAGGKAEPLNIWLGDWQIQAENSETLFPLNIRARADGIAIDLILQPPSKPMVLQGDRGFSRKGRGEGNASYYYSYTRIPTRGRILFDNEDYSVSGNSWFDREWSSSALANDQAGWDWLSLQLDDGREVMFYRMRDKSGQAQSFSNGVLIDEQGRTSKLDLTNTRMSPLRYWENEQGVAYPVAWSLELRDENLSLTVEAAIDDQEMRHAVRYWEGAVRVSGAVTGVGYLELSGYDS